MYQVLLIDHLELIRNQGMIWSMVKCHIAVNVILLIGYQYFFDRHEDCR